MWGILGGQITYLAFFLVVLYKLFDGWGDAEGGEG